MKPPIPDTRPCLFWRKKDLNFNYLAGPMKKMAIPQHGPENKFQLWTQNIKMAGGVG